MSLFYDQVKSSWNATATYHVQVLSGNILCDTVSSVPFVTNGSPLYGQPGAVPNETSIGFAGNAADYFEGSSDATTNLGDGFSVGAMVRTTAAATQTILSRATTGYSFGMDATGHLILVKVGTATIVTSTVTINDGAWHYVIAVKNGAVSTVLYVDGVDVSGVVTDQTIVATGGPTDLGRELQTTNQPWNGNIGAFQIRNSFNVSAAQALLMYQAYQASLNSIIGGSIAGQRGPASRSENMFPNGPGRSKYMQGTLG